MTAAAGAALIWCPFPDVQSAGACAKRLLDARLIACANILPGLISVFDWDGSRSEATEAGMLAKTDARLLDAAVAHLAQWHPYAEPAITGWRADAASPGTLAWLAGLVP